MDSNIRLVISNEARLGIFLVVIFFLVYVGGRLLLKGVALLESAEPADQMISIKEINRGNLYERQVIFTFDGGSADQSGEKILAVLAKHGAKGTFFLTGRFIDSNQDLVRKIIYSGHEVFNHTYNHPHLIQLSEEEIATEFRKTELSLNIVAGVSTKPFFRPPYGDRDDRVLRAAFKEGYQSVYWTVDAGDWEESLGISAEEVKARILNNVAPGNIYLMHLGDKITGEILDDVLTAIEIKGYRVVSLGEGIIYSNDQ